MMFKLWSFRLTITRRDQILTEINETLRKVAVEEDGTTGVQILADRFRKADGFARSYERRIFELEESIKEYERVFRIMKAAEEHPALPFAEDQRTPIEQAARWSSGVDLPVTQKSQAYAPMATVETGRSVKFNSPEGDRPREVPALSETRRERILPTEPETDKKA